MRNEAERIIWQLREFLDVLGEAADVTDLASKRQQLQGIARAVQQLESTRIAVPEELKKLKADLLDEIGVADEAEQTLNYLRNELEGLIERVGHPITGVKRRRRATGTPQSKTISKERLRQVMIDSLRALGGSGRSSDVLDAMAVQLNGELCSGDLQQRDNLELVWRNNARWERTRMIDEGILRRDSPRGMWELA